MLGVGKRKSSSTVVSKPQRDWRSVTGRAPQVERQLLRECGYSDHDIDVMDPKRQAAEIEEAIGYGFYAGCLPPAPVDEIETQGFFFDLESGKPIKLTAALERSFGYQSARSRPVRSFKQALVGFQHDERMDSADRGHLERLSNDERMKDHWGSLCRVRPLDPSMAPPGWFLWHMLVARRAAESVNDYPQRQDHARNLETLTSFLRKKGQTDERSLRLLRELASQLREPEEFQPFKPFPISVSRKAHAFGHGASLNSRVVNVFMKLMSNHLKAVYGRPFHEIVATLTDIAFPGRETTLDHVRNAVKLGRRVSRPGTPKSAHSKLSRR
jgi:hypothetical protein